MEVTIPLFRISQPPENLFKPLVATLLKECKARHGLVNKEQSGVLYKRQKLCKLMLDALYQAHCSQLPNTGVALSLSPRYYTNNDTNNTLSYSYREVRLVFNSLQSLGWIKAEKGYLPLGGKGVPTAMRADGELANILKSNFEPWLLVYPIGDPLILKSKNAIKANRVKLPIPNGSKARLMRTNLNAINNLLSEQAICLNLTNDQLKAMCQKMADRNYKIDRYDPQATRKPRTLNFSHVHLRRIFARGQMNLGGRFYGGWWQNIPKDYRRYITINGCQTVEVDFSTLHPTLLFLENNLDPPADFYDLGLKTQGNPRFEPDPKKYEIKRKIIKGFANALINDERGVHKLDDEAVKTLGMGSAELKDLLIKTHPVFAKAIKSDAGVRYQFIDSRIAEAVMVKLLKQNIVCLCVHDSFVVIDAFQDELVTAMKEAFTEVVKADATLKPAELPIDGFEVHHTNMQKLSEEMLSAFSRAYNVSWYRQNLRNTGRTNSIFEPKYTLPE
jgi:uncharacterized coiled-coil protein SlyX